MGPSLMVQSRGWYKWACPMASALRSSLSSASCSTRRCEHSSFQYARSFDLGQRCNAQRDVLEVFVLTQIELTFHVALPCECKILRRQGWKPHAACGSWRHSERVLFIA